VLDVKLSIFLQLSNFLAGL